MIHGDLKDPHFIGPHYLKILTWDYHDLWWSNEQYTWGMERPRPHGGRNTIYIQ